MRFIIFIGALFFFSPFCRAHGMRTAYLEISEGGGHAALATWRTTFVGTSAKPIFPEGCTAASLARGETQLGITSYELQCGSDLAGRYIGVSGMGTFTTESVIHITLKDGTEASTVLTPQNPSWLIPKEGSFAETFFRFVRMGIFHILSGSDHLLFLIALLILVRSPRNLLMTSTAFTFAHSITLSLTVLGWLRVSSQAAEACIALSLLLVALDMTGKEVAKDGPRLAFVFGLVHGLGFAGALTEVGIPQAMIPLSLLGFNVGVEIGQVGFLILVWLVIRLLGRTKAQSLIPYAASYVVGGLGAFWLIQRLVILFY